MQIRPLFVVGAYNRRAIMSAAIEAARARRAVTGEAWNICLSAALKGTWQVAKEARSFAAHQAQRAVEQAQLAKLRGTLDNVILPTAEAYRAPSHCPQQPAIPGSAQHALSKSVSGISVLSASRISAPQRLLPVSR